MIYKQYDKFHVVEEYHHTEFNPRLGRETTEIVWRFVCRGTHGTICIYKEVPTFECCPFCRGDLRPGPKVKIFSGAPAKFPFGPITTQGVIQHRYPNPR